MPKTNWELLFKEARKLLADEDRRHDISCGCQDVDDSIEKGGFVEGHCPGLDERKEFLKKTRKHALQREG